MKYEICEHNLDRPGRCRKHAKFAVCYRSYFGERVGPDGVEKLFVERSTPRCPLHTELEKHRGAFLVKPLRILVGGNWRDA